MKRVLTFAALAAAIAMAGSTLRSANPKGTPAPVLKPTEWLNTQGKDVTWSKLKGRVILVEKWATT